MDSVKNWMKHRSRISAGKTAVIDGETGEAWSYRQLWQRVERLAGYLRNQGIAYGDRVALLSPNHICYLELLFACGQLGAIFVPLNWRLATNELNYILNDCKPSLLVVHPDSSHQAVIEAIQQGIAVFEINGQEYSHVMSDEEVSYIDSSTHHAAPLFQTNDPLAIIYTGGTTGRPKGVVLSHMSIFWNATNTIISWNLSEDEITPTYLPMFHTGGLNALSIPVLMAGGTVVIARSFDAQSVIRLLNDQACTIALMVPTMYHMLIQTKEFMETSFPMMHTFLSGGAPCPHPIYEAFAAKGVAFKEGYGATESGPNNFFIRPGDAVHKPGCVGKHMVLSQAKVVNVHGEELAVGEVGELLLAGSHLFERYWNEPAITAQAFDHGWFRTGDLAKKDADGDFYIVGRCKDMIITGGENVYPVEVETLIAGHSAVSSVAVVGLPHDKWGEIVAAAIVLHDGHLITEDELRTYCAKSIGKYKIPKTIRFVSQLPLTDVGKLDKNKIIQQFLNTMDTW
ncbi:long-chain fatty acid--CoA ligase [Paenibacillus albiflavus]|uniref:Long-chain fatty acid--CoA ligase n=1 Tax=Paenibacillus albiflavus TaxID=2545760 RepID=A0A4R4EBT1_9BACL|nr:long-chain fatty acid--CoA ligase [Paenibacillus albiflavus]TCZ77139.1 long-chain fatty acid--CoA ligase [Paenibacillus albiflavus]